MWTGASLASWWVPSAGRRCLSPISAYPGLARDGVPRLLDPLLQPVAHRQLAGIGNHALVDRTEQGSEFALCVGVLAAHRGVFRDAAAGLRIAADVVLQAP
jgi:hypothetical protein